jgi:hypothetical protein
MRFQHWRKISSFLFRNTLAPTVILATPGNYLVIEAPKTRSCYEYHPLGRSKKVRRRWAARLRQAQKETIGLAQPGRPPKNGLPDNPIKPTLASQGIDKNLALPENQLRVAGG